MKAHLVVKPKIFAVVTPIFLKHLFRFTVASIAAYLVFSFFKKVSLINYDTNRLIISLIIISILLSIISIKHRIIKLHNTTYKFYDTHVVEEQKFIKVKKKSIPYAQITKIINNSNLWDRITNSSDIILQTRNSSNNDDLVLKAVPDPDNIEQKIFELIKQNNKLVQKIDN